MSGVAWLCSLGLDSSACASTGDFDAGQEEACPDAASPTPAQPASTRAQLQVHVRAALHPMQVKGSTCFCNLKTS